MPNHLGNCEWAVASERGGRSYTPSTEGEPAENDDDWLLHDDQTAPAKLLLLLDVHKRHFAPTIVSPAAPPDHAPSSFSAFIAGKG